jgi:hypothetical protein
MQLNYSHVLYVCGLDSSGSGYPVEGVCEHINELFEFNKEREISLLAERLVDSPEGFCSIKLLPYIPHACYMSPLLHPL